LYQKKLSICRRAESLIRQYLPVEKAVYRESKSYTCGKLVSLLVKVGRRWYRFNSWEEDDLRMLEVKLKEWKQRAEFVKSLRERRHPVFRAGDFVLYLPKEGNELRVPENLIPHVIGRGGEGIKAISMVVGRRMRIVKAPPVQVSRKTRVWRIEDHLVNLRIPLETPSDEDLKHVGVKKKEKE
jgi:hypothetical protein